MKPPTKILLTLSGVIGLFIAIGRFLNLLSAHMLYYNNAFMVFRYHNALLPLLSAILILTFIYEVLTWESWATFYSELVKKGE